MKKLAIIFLLCIAFGCSISNEFNTTSNEPNTTEKGVSWNLLSSAPKIDISKENLPGWLIGRINDYYEIWPPLVSKVLIYRGEWNKQTVYFVMDMHSSCLCDIFTKEGERINNQTNFRATSKNWVLIYEYGDFVLNLDELFSN